MKLPLLKILCLAIAATNTPSAFALVELEDDALSETTGEGVAILPENFAVSMNGADAANGGAGTYGTGYMHFIPVGPLTATAVAKGYQKADNWLYGVSLAQSKKDYGATIDGTDWGVPFGAFGSAATDFGRGITSWGTAENPWLIKTTTEAAPNFVGVSNDVTHLDLIAPLYHATQPAAGTPASSAYNLKLGYWMDFAMRDAAVPESGYNGLSNRLRFAVTWDSFGINGSNVKLFQTLDGVTSAMGGTYTALLKINGVPNQSRTFNYGMSTSYNKTFGLAGLFRLNSGITDTNERRGVVSNQTNTRQIIRLDYDPLTNYDVTSNSRAGHFFENGVLATSAGAMASGTAEPTNTTDGITETYQPMTETSLKGPAGQTPPYAKSYPGSFPNGGVCTDPDAIPNVGSGNSQYGQCVSKEGFTTRRFKVYGTNDWTPPAQRSVLRISTQELASAAAGIGTPALGGGGGWSEVPDFRPNASAEGIFIYDMNVNMVLGSLYQPLMLSADGNNFSFELARIPNNSNVYRKIYTRYPGDLGDAGITYEGSTCNIYQCGTAVTYGGVGYQGSTATHSSITIGATDRINSKIVNSITYNNVNQIEAHKGVGAYGVSIGELKADTGIYSENVVDYTQVWLRTRGFQDVGCGFFCTTQEWTAYGAWGAVAPKPALAGQEHPSLNRPNPYETVQRQNYNNQILGLQTTMPVGTMAATINAMGSPGGSVSNNFGSAVIDGLLIQHLKFTTTGL